MTYNLVETITQRYTGAPFETQTEIIVKPAKTSGGRQSIRNHHTDVPYGALAITQRAVKHHSEYIDVCTLFYCLDETINDALKASGLAWFDKFTGGWNLPLIMDQDNAEYIAKLASDHFDTLIDMDENISRSRETEASCLIAPSSVELMPFHVWVSMDHVRHTIHELIPDENLDVPFYIHAGGGYEEWPKITYDPDREFDDLKSQYPFLLICYDNDDGVRKYVIYNVLGRIAERVETGAGRTTRELFVRIARTVRKTGENTFLRDGDNDIIIERPGDRVRYRGDIPLEIFDAWAAMCSYPVPHALCAEYTLPCGKDREGRLLREPVRPGRDAAPSTDIYLRRVADFFGGDLKDHETDPYYASWPDKEMGFDGKSGEEKPDDGKAPILIERHLDREDHFDALAIVAYAMTDCFRSSDNIENPDLIERIVFELLGFNTAHQDPEERKRFLAALDAASQSAGSLPHHAESLSMLAAYVKEALNG